VTGLLAVLDVWTPGITPGSPAEMRLLRQIADWGFPVPEAQIELRDSDGRLIGRIDLGWRETRLGLEYDADRTHNPRHWERDEARHPRYAAMGWQVYRIDKSDLRAGQNWLRDLLSRRLHRRAS
jgi:hypothetical protein